MFNQLMLVGVGIVIFTIAQAVGSALQAYKIFRSQSAEAVSVSWFVYYLAASIAQIDYGVWRGWEEMILYNGGVLVVSQLPVLVGLWKYKKWLRRDWIIVALSTLATTFMYSTVHKRETFSAIMALIIFAAYLQTREMWLKGRGRVDVRLQIIYLISALVWTFYFFWREDPVFMWVNPTYSLLVSANVVLWYYDRPNRRLRDRPKYA
ncbi:hypothetical protein H6758_03700 [Candidatus Nomurabacteria bacterium]|nr:hypothetical protein [Candidatus Nomurabacteria bacterium]